MKDVTEIRFEIVVDGQRRRMIFLRPEKIAGLLNADDITVGTWLCEMRDKKHGDPVTPDRD